MYALETYNLRKIYKSGTEALKGIDLKVKQGDFYALLGANGAGKSTTIGLISTLLNITSGTIKIMGFDLQKERDKAKANLGIVPQEFNLNIFLKCEQILIEQAGYYGMPRKQAKHRAGELLDLLGLNEKKKHIVRELSGGMKRRLMIARALMHRPELLILDEPTAGVDIEIRHSMWAFLKEINAQGTTIILTTHYLEEAEQLCKNIAIIHKGLIVEEGSMQQLLKNLHHQTFIFSSQHPLESLPEIPGFHMSQLDDVNVELRVDQSISLNTVFEKLSQHKIEIHSMRNKTNRLEELFMDMIKK